MKKRKNFRRITISDNEHWQWKVGKRCIVAYCEETQEKLEELESYFSELQNTEMKDFSPLELLGRMQMEKQLDDDFYENKDMRILFQKCRDQIEDEYNKKKQTEKENEKTKRKIEDLKIRMKMKKQKFPIQQLYQLLMKILSILTRIKQF